MAMGLTDLLRENAAIISGVVFGRGMMRAEEFKEKWGLTQESLAELIGSSRSTISHWASVGRENKERKEPLTVERLLDLLDTLFTQIQFAEEFADRNPVVMAVWRSRKIKKQGTPPPP